MDCDVSSLWCGSCCSGWGAYKLAWEVSSKPLKGELVHAWYVKTESPEPLQLPQYFNVPLELTMSQWMSMRKKWDGTIAKRASEGKSLTPSAAKSYQAFLDTPFRKIVIDTKSKTYIPRPSSATAATMQTCLVMEIKMNLDPSHLALRFGNGPFYHLFVRQFEVSETQARHLVKPCTPAKCRPIEYGFRMFRSV